MGSGVYSSIAYRTLSDDRGYAKASRDQLFKSISVNASNTAASFNVNARSFNTQVKAKMVNVGVRDSQEHPHSTPIIIALDVTGSMMNTPYEMIKNHLPKIMDSVMQMGVRDPQLLFMAVGDHEYDRYPIQVGQFESDTEKILNSLESLVIEGGGGGNAGESYLLAHIVAGYHTETDSWFKRHTKGFLFTIGDDLQGIPGNSLTEILGYQKGAGSISANEAILKAQEQYHVFHIHITNASYGTRVAKSWKNLLGQNVLMCKSDEVDKVIAKAIKDNYEEPVYAETPSDASSSTTTEDKQNFY